MRRVEEIRDVRLQDEMHPLGYGELLGGAEVLQLQSRTLQNVDATIAEGARGGHCERARIEPTIGRPLSVGQISIRDAIRQSARSVRVRRIRSGKTRREILAALQIGDPGNLPTA